MFEAQGSMKLPESVFPETRCRGDAHRDAGAAPAGTDGRRGCGCGHDGCEGEAAWRWRLLAPAALFAAGLASERWLAGAPGRFIWHAVMFAAYALCGFPVLGGAWAAIRKRDFFNEFTLMGFASLAAIGLGQIAEAVGVMLFYSVGETLQDMAAGRSRASIKALLASRPESAAMLVDGRIEVVDPGAVPVAGIILVKPGEKIPLDGVVTTGSAGVDMSSLTGEPEPVARKAGDGVYGGSICLDGNLTIRTTSLYADSAIGRILSMTEEAAKKKSRTERFISAFARRYTPAVAAAAALVAVAPPLFAGQAWGVWGYRALVLLVVSCPCALVLSVPLAFFAGIGAAARHGVFVRGGNVFDAVLKAGTVIFDKTGTVTEGRPALAETRPAPGVDPAELLRLAAIAESRSSHPAARAVMAAAGDDFVFHGDVAVRDHQGKGVVADTSAGVIAVGNAALLTDLGISLEADPSPRSSAHVAVGGRYLGTLYFEDRIKPGMAAVVRALRRDAGVRTVYMLTGDRPETAERVSREIGLDGFEAALLPEGKMKAYDRLSPDGGAVFVGDGVNDAPVLAKAGVGVAMGALGAAAAVEAADAVVLDDSPARVPVLFRVARRVRATAWQNIVFALFVKGVFMALGVAGVAGLWEAVFADVGVALLSVLNAMRAARLPAAAPA